MGCSTSRHGLEVIQDVPEEALQGQVFIMVNESSGGNAAKALLDLKTSHFDFDNLKGEPCRAYFFNVKSREDRERGLGILGDQVSAERPNLRVVVAGGDGSVKWVLSELIRFGLAQIPIGVIPFGTGNDFSRATGFGGAPPSPLIGHHKSALIARLRMMLDASTISLDVWKIRIHKGAGGKFMIAQGGQIVETQPDDDVMEQEMINYFSMGSDARIVFEFEQLRTASQLGNKLVYVQRGANQIVHSPPRLRKMVRSMHGDTEENVKFRKADRILAFLNIPSYSAGANIWGKPSPSNRGHFLPQYVGDGKLEACTIRGTPNVAMVIGTGAKIGIKRTAQCSSYEMEFVPDSEIYIQIDGEPVLAKNPSRVTIELGYKVNVLRASGALAIASSIMTSPSSAAVQAGGSHIRTLVPGQPDAIHTEFVTSDFDEDHDHDESDGSDNENDENNEHIAMNRKTSPGSKNSIHKRSSRAQPDPEP